VGFVDVAAGFNRKASVSVDSDPHDPPVTQPAEAGFVDVAAGFNRRSA